MYTLFFCFLIFRIKSLPLESSGTVKDLGSVTEDLAENVKEQISEHATLPEVTSTHMKDEDGDTSANREMGSPSLDPNSEFKKGSEGFIDDLAPKIQSKPGISVSKR